MSLQAIIFDCDGTLADSMPPHYLAWRSTLAEYGIDFSEDLFYETGGWPTVKVARYLLERDGVEADADKISEDKEDAFEQLLHTVKPIDDVIAVVREHHGKLPMAVATGGIPRVCHAILDNLGIRDCFGAIVTALDVERPKPNPDVYLEAARRLGVDPTACRAYEDTDPGVQSATAAGMEVIDVRTFYTPARITG